jgi:uncharacterized membrane protein
MVLSSAASGDEVKAVRRARHCFYGIGIAFVVLGFALEMVPALAAVSAPLAARICAGLGAVILSVGRFGSDRFVNRCERALTGWF